MCALKCIEESSDFIDCRHNGKTRQTLYPPKSVQVAHFALNIEEEDRIERLRLRRGSDLALGRQRVDEGCNADGTYVPWMSALMEVDVLADPEAICLLGPSAEMAAATDSGNHFQKARGGGGLTP